MSVTQQALDTYKNALQAGAINPTLWPPTLTGVVTMEPSKATHITVTPVSNGFVIKVSKNSTPIERIVSDFENIGDGIMAALAEIQLGK